MIGETIREYEIVSELGAGGYGVVYLAHDNNIDRDVAIKVILPQYANQPEFIENFEAEARLVAQLEHKDIVPLYAYWRDEQGAYLVMRYIRGGSLRGVLSKQGALPISKVVRIVEQIAEALNIAHEAGVVHRDLKPDNILIDERGNAYLTDFGIAKQLSEEEAQSATDAIKGTFAYLSPEQIQQTQVSPQTDIYAFGIMLYEMLAGQHPFQETPVGMMIMKHLQESLPDVRNVRDNLDGEIHDIIQKATAKDPEERYSSTLELITDLKSAISGVPMTTPVPVQPVITKKKPSSPEERNRYAMLENVRTFWIEGVLENSLHDAAMIDLGMISETGAVDNPWDTLLRTPNGEDTPIEGNIIDVFDRMNGKLLILGDPGSGKTTTLLSLARDLLVRAEMDNQHPIPVVFNLSSWSENQLPLTDWLVEELNGKYQVPRKVATQWIEDEELLLLLDGLDEVAEDVRDACVNTINTYRSEHGFVDMVVCSRIEDYEALSNQLKLNGAIVIQALNDEQTVQYLDALGTDVAVVQELISHDEQLRQLSKSPLMLSIMVLAYRGKSADDIPDFNDVETQRQHLFEVYVERMFDRRIGAKSYTKEETQHYLSWLAKQMQEQTQSVFQIEELQPTIIPESQRTAYYRRVRAVHMGATIIAQSIMAVLVAIAFNLPIIVMVGGWGIVGGAWTGWTYGGDEWKYLRSQMTNGLIFGTTTLFTLWLIYPFEIALLFGLLSTVGFVAWPRLGTEYYFSSGGDMDTIPLMETVRFSRANIRVIHWLLVFILTVSIVPLVVGLYIISLKLPGANFVPGWITLALSLGSGTVVVSGLEFGKIPTRFSPNQGVQTTFRLVSLISVATGVSTVVWAIILALIIGAPIWRGFVLGLGLGIGMVGYGTWTVFGGIGVYRHWMLRQTLTRRGYLPANLARFLDYASDLILMRKVGGGYIFVHRYLLEYFADLENDD